MPFMFENLDVYQRAVDLADRIIIRTKDAPRGFGFFTDQLNRAALSISTNLAEGNDRFTKADRRHLFTIARGSIARGSIARGSVRECVPLLELARRHDLIPQPDHDALRTELEEISRMLSGLINGLDRRRARVG